MGVDSSCLNRDVTVSASGGAALFCAAIPPALPATAEPRAPPPARAAGAFCRFLPLCVEVGDGAGAAFEAAAEVAGAALFATSSAFTSTVSLLAPGARVVVDAAAPTPAPEALPVVSLAPRSLSFLNSRRSARDSLSAGRPFGAFRDSTFFPCTAVSPFESFVAAGGGGDTSTISVLGGTGGGASGAVSDGA